jgi:hypothetical protein
LKRARALVLESRPTSMNFTTTRVFSAVWSANHTAPIPPEPSGLSRRTLGVTCIPAASVARGWFTASSVSQSLDETGIYDPNA